MNRSRLARSLRTLGTASLAAASLAAGTGHAAILSSDMVTVRSGALQGLRQGQVEVFRRIPYAAPPVGTLRWRAPQPADNWSGVRDASVAAPACIQPPGPPAAGAAPAETSEDCLYLNIWRPAVKRRGPVPVMVWIHGGAFRTGSGALPLYDGSALAARGVIVVTINYRLGPLGFFSHPALRAEAAGAAGGNYGLLDQIAALQWVRDNIGAFGGDAGNVTAFGESAGGASILYLMASPLAKGLFARAIVESGGLALNEPDLDAADEIGRTMAARVPGAKPDSTPAAQLARLRALAARDLLAMPGNRADTMPFIDGQVVTGPLRASFVEGSVQRIPLLIGRNSDEAGFFPPPFWRGTPAMLGDEWRQARLLADPGQEQSEDWAARKIAGDLFAGVKTRALADALAATGVPVYQYYFDYTAAATRRKGEGAIHTGDLAYVFGTLAPEAAAQDRIVSRRLGDLWTSFARTGMPSSGTLAWPRYDATGRLLVIAPDGFSVQPDPAASRLDFLDRPWPGAVN